jgi:hypothetical protein
MNTYTHYKLKFDENAWQKSRTDAFAILAMHAALLGALILASHPFAASVIGWVLVQLLFGLILAIVVVAHLEYLTHRFLMHSKSLKADWLKKFSKDHLVHHTVYAEGNYDRPADRFADETHLHKDKPLRFFGLTSCTEYPVVMGMPFALVAVFQHQWFFLGCLLPIIFSYTFFFNLFHECTHQDWKPSCIPDFFYWKICYQHLLHHNHHRKDTNGNYGVMFLSLCDHLYGTYVAPCAEDQADWEGFRRKVRTSPVPLNRAKAKERCLSEKIKLALS